MVPEDSDIFDNAKKAFKFMPESLNEIEIKNKLAIGFESKEKGKLLTLAAFNEMIDFDQKLNALQVSKNNPIE